MQAAHLTPPKAEAGSDRRSPRAEDTSPIHSLTRIDRTRRKTASRNLPMIGTLPRRMRWRSSPKRSKGSCSLADFILQTLATESALSFMTDRKSFPYECE